MKLFITGDSHIAAIKRGYHILKGQNDSFGGLEIVFMRTDSEMRKSMYIDALTPKLPKYISLYLRELRKLKLEFHNPDMWVGLSGPMMDSFVTRRPDLDKYAFSDADTEGIPVSKAMREAIVLDDQHHHLELIRELKKAGAKVFVIEAPLPFLELYEKLNLPPEKKVVPFSQLYRQRVKQALAEMDVPLIEIPEHCVNDRGGMKIEYHVGKEDDFHHCSPEYGVLMLKKIIDHFTKVTSTA